MQAMSYAKHCTHIHIFMTGGTIDSSLDVRTGSLSVDERSFIPKYFSALGKSLKPYCKLHFTPVCSKDSQDIDDNDRSNLATAIESSDCTNIIVTHGTITMAHTARYLSKH